MSRRASDLTATPLGRRMLHLGYSITEVSRGAGVPIDTLTDYLNGRNNLSGSKPEGSGKGHSHTNTYPHITPRHLARLSMFLKCDAGEIRGTS